MFDNIFFGLIENHLEKKTCYHKKKQLSTFKNSILSQLRAVLA